jgi:diguanylate cyclase (GGDEF)-like protein
MREPLALLLLDVDHFKQVNDLYGHPAGDATLRALARLLRRHLRPFDVVGRYGGEEFLVLLSGATQQGGLTAAERLRALIAATPFDVQGIIRLTASVGVVSSEPPHTVPFAQLLASADRALYRAKHSGRNQVKPGVLTTAPARPPEDAARGTILSFGDMTERKRAREALRQSEEQLRQSQKMEAVGRLAGGVAHDFNNLLTAITGYSQLALNGLGDRDPVRKDIEEIRKAADRAASLTHQLLAFSRRQVLEPKVLDLNAVVADMETMLRRLIGEDIDLISILDPAAGQVTADPGQLEQVLLNLAVNARDAMPQGGKLVIETANAELDEAYAARHVAVRPGPYVMLAVSDTGHGMDAETRARVFEPFFTTKEPGKGTGLGLSTVYGIVKQSGGHIWVYSEPEHGTTFKIYLPRVEDAAETPVPHAQPLTPAGGAETILLVEDDGGVRSLARRVLESKGYRVLEARQGDEALAISAWYDGPIALMLTDLVMPGKGGRELARCFASVRPDMRVLYMSGYTDNAIFQQQVFDPGTAFLSKPFTPDELARKVREVLDTARSGEQAPA